jgi:hypothetical protein
MSDRRKRLPFRGVAGRGDSCARRAMIQIRGIARRARLRVGLGNSRKGAAARRRIQVKRFRVGKNLDTDYTDYTD